MAAACFDDECSDHAERLEKIMTLLDMRKARRAWNAETYSEDFEARPDLRVLLVDSVCNNLNALHTPIGVEASAWVHKNREEIKRMIANEDPLQRALQLARLALRDAIIDIPLPWDIGLSFFKLKCGTHLAAAKQLSGELDVWKEAPVEERAKTYLQRIAVLYNAVTTTSSACDRSCIAYLTAVLHLLYIPDFYRIPGMDDHRDRNCSVPMLQLG